MFILFFICGNFKSMILCSLRLNSHPLFFTLVITTSLFIFIPAFSIEPLSKESTRIFKHQINHHKTPQFCHKLTMAISKLPFIHLLFFFLIPAVNSIGVNYGTLGDNLPPPTTVARFLESNTIIDRVRIFDANPDVLKAFSGTNILVSVTIPNGDIPSLNDPWNARRWVNANIKPFYPATKIHYICVGTEVLHWGPQSIIDHLLSTMRVLHAALIKAGIKDIKVSSPHSLSILSSSNPPSKGSFRSGWDVKYLAPMLRFHRETKSGFMVNPYTYYAYSPGNESYCLFKPNAGLYDKATGKRYI